jgi:hypothetical protein
VRRVERKPREHVCDVCGYVHTLRTIHLVFRVSTAVPALNLVLHFCRQHHSKSVDVRYDALDLEMNNECV